MSKRIYSLQWSAVENAQTYRVFRSLTEVGNKQELVLTSNRSLELNQYISGSSDYYYFIKAQATGYQDSDYSTPLRWKTFSISRSVDAGVIETTDDSFVGEGFGYNTGFVAPGGKIFNRAVCLLTIGGIQHPEYISFLTDDKAFNIDIPAEAVTGDIVYSAVVQDEITQLTAPAIAMNADGKTLEITDVADATSYDVYVDGTLKTNVVSAPNTTTVDLSTLSDIADGAHTVKVKAKASGYNDSEFSNEVSYTKAPAGQKITTLSIEDEASWKDSWDIYIKFDGVASPTNYDARFKNDKSVSENRDRIYYNGVWSAKWTDVTVDITATQWSAYVAEQEYTNYVWPCATNSSFFKTVSPSTNGILYPMGRDNNKFIVKQPAD